MAFDREFLKLMRQEITIRPRTGRNAYNESTFGPAETYKARIEGSVKEVRTFSGEERVSTTTIYVAGTPAVGPEDQLTLPDGRRPQILSVTRESDEHGDHHVVIFT